MLALGWIFGATVLLSTQQNSLALPTTHDHATQAEHLTNAYLIEGQDPPPCGNEICPQLVTAVRASVPTNSTSNGTTPTLGIQPGKATISGDDEAEALKKNTDYYSAVTASCSSSAEDEKYGPRVFPSAKHERLRNVGQSPCHPYHSSSADPMLPSQIDIGTNDSTQYKSTKSGGGNNYSSKKYVNSTVIHGCRAANRNGSRLPATHQTAPIKCGDGVKPPCGKEYHAFNQSSNPTTFRFPGTHQTAPIKCGDGGKPPCGKQSRFPGTHQTAPIKCGDGGKPPCGKESRLHGTHQTAPIKCGDGGKSPCGKESRFPGTLQTAPIKCGDGGEPPCGKESRFPGTHQTAPIVCGDEGEPPCGKGSRFPGTHQTAPIKCGDGSEPPCGIEYHDPNHSSNPTIPRFPGTHTTAPITCGDGSQPPCDL